MAEMPPNDVCKELPRTSISRSETFRVANGQSQELKRKKQLNFLLMNLWGYQIRTFPNLRNGWTYVYLDTQCASGWIAACLGHLVTVAIAKFSCCIDGSSSTDNIRVFCGCWRNSRYADYTKDWEVDEKDDRRKFCREKRALKLLSTA